jgi:hypothetical protein
MELSPSLDIDPGITKQLLEVIRDVLPDLVLVLIKGLPGNFIAPADVPVLGTHHAIFRFRFDSKLFDQEVRAAVRAFGLQNDVAHAVSKLPG